MSIIERNQTKLIFEEAARRGVVFSDTPSVPSIYQEILGFHDIGERYLGSPLTAIYEAKTGELIDVKRIAKYFSSILRDVKVLDSSLTELENSIYMTNLELWARNQLLKSRSSYISKSARTERLRAVYGAAWAFSETFHDTSRLDMEQTSAWIDAAEGIAFLPNNGDEQSIAPSFLSVSELVIPTGVSLLGSGPYMAVDGLDATNCRAMFPVPTEEDVSFVITLQEPRDLMAISIDPVGFGTIISVDADKGQGLVNIIKSVIYNKKTFPIELNSVSKLRVSFRPSATAYPKTVGIRAMTLYNSLTSRFAAVYSKGFKPSFPFTQVKIETEAEIPNGSTVIPYFATASAGPWTKLDTGDWKSVDELSTQSVSIDFFSAQEVGGVFYISTGGNPSTSSKDGTLEVGEGQMEVSAIRKDYTELGESPHMPEPGDFDTEDVIKTWTGLPKFDINPTSTLIQSYGTDIASSYGVTRGQQILFQRKNTSYPYTELCFVPMGGTVSENTMQFNHTYRFRVWMHCSKEGFYDQGKYWFYQGYRLSGARTYREIGKSYSAFSVYLNGQLIANDVTPYTITSSNEIESGGDNGRDFSLKFLEGWNLFEVYLHLLDPAVFYGDAFEVGNPYVQLNMTPCIFDPNFQLDYHITAVLGSGQKGPVDEFDLLWNLAQDPTYWAWSDDRQYILFNKVSTKPIDGYFAGTYPNSKLLYTGIGEETNDLFVRIDLEREGSAQAGPILSEYRVMVR